jgi:uncharacterized protein YlxP (DUF503 family)
MSAVHVGVLSLRLRIEGARTLKDRRQVVHSLRDRVRHRFEVTWNEVDPGEEPTRCHVVCTTAGGDARLVRSVLDRIREFVDGSGHAWAEVVDVDVFPWHPPDAPWPMEEPTDG